MFRVSDNLSKESHTSQLFGVLVSVPSCVLDGIRERWGGSSLGEKGQMCPAGVEQDPHELSQAGRKCLHPNLHPHTGPPEKNMDVVGEVESGTSLCADNLWTPQSQWQTDWSVKWSGVSVHNHTARGSAWDRAAGQRSLLSVLCSSLPSGLIDAGEHQQAAVGLEFSPALIDVGRRSWKSCFYISTAETRHLKRKGKQEEEETLSNRECLWAGLTEIKSRVNGLYYASYVSCSTLVSWYRKWATFHATITRKQSVAVCKHWRSFFPVADLSGKGQLFLLKLQWSNSIALTLWAHKWNSQYVKLGN